jgi:hypothetical protein
MATAPLACYRPWLAAKAQLQTRDRVVALRGAEGNVIDEIAVIAGEYLVIDSNGAETLPAADFVCMYDAMPHAGPLAHVRRAPVQSLAQPLDGPQADEFSRRWLRCTVDGALICSVDAPLSLQAAAVMAEQDRASGAAHMAVLRALREHASAAPIYEPGLQADVFTFDVVTAGLEPAPVRVDEIPAGLMPEDVPQLADEMAQTAGLAELPWMAMGTTFSPRLPQIQALAHHLFSGLTDVPLERIQMAAESAMEEPGAVVAFAAWLRVQGEHRPLERQPDFSNLAPGYEPRADRFALADVEFLLVEDFSGTFVYAWPDRAPIPLPRPFGS